MWGLAYCKYRFCLVIASQTQSLSTWPHLFNTQCPPAPTFRRSWWASNSGGQLHCNASLSRGQWFLPMWKCKYQGVNCHSHLLAMTVGCLPDCPAQPGAWQPWPARAKHKAIPLVPEVYLETDKGNFTNVLLIVLILINQYLSRSIWKTMKNYPPLKSSWLQTNSLVQAVTVLFGSATDHQLVSPCIMKARSLQWVPKLYCSCLELVKEWVGKIHPSFLQTLHISPILDQILIFSTYCIATKLKRVKKLL